MWNKVLLVDDDRFNLWALRRRLAHDFEVHTAVGAAAALESIKRQPMFAALLVDLHMPEMEGLWFLKKLESRMPQAARIVVSKRIDPDVVQMTFKEGLVSRLLISPSAGEIALHLDIACKQFHHRFFTARSA